MTAHSEWGASNAHRWINCPGSVAAQRGKPDTAGLDALRGTAAHTVLELVFDPNMNRDTPYAWLGEDVDGVEIDEEICGRVQIAVDAVRELYNHEVDAHGQGSVTLLTETRVYLPHIHSECFGTADIIIISPSRLVVFDYKNGSGVPVEIIKNSMPNAQVLYYATGALMHCMANGYRFLNNSPTPPEIKVVICQPARGGTKPLTFTYDDLFDFGTILSSAVKRTLNADAPRVAGDWCKFCRAAGECAELQQFALEQACATFDANGNLVQPAPYEIEDKNAAALLRAIPAIMTWCEAYAEHRQRMAMQGSPTPGYMLVDVKGHREWNGEESAIASQLKGYGAKPADIFNFRLRTPAQVEKAPLPEGIRRSQWEGIISSLSTRPDRGVKLVPCDTREPTTRAGSGPFQVEDV